IDIPYPITGGDYTKTDSSPLVAPNNPTRLMFMHSSPPLLPTVLYLYFKTILISMIFIPFIHDSIAILMSINILF
ncbi:MAG: hypothetical protein ACFFBD_15590, partial [Candidatus Hodarchaeota archaeon]